MPTKHIVQYGYSKFAFDTVSAAAAAVAFFSKLKPVKFASGSGSERWYYEPETDRDREISMELNAKTEGPPTKTSTEANQ